VISHFRISLCLAAFHTGIAESIAGFVRRKLNRKHFSIPRIPYSYFG